MSTKKKSIFQEAVEEAKTIREAAIANAKAALEESFMPHVKEMLSTKLQEMDEETEDLEENELPISEEEESFDLPLEEEEMSDDDDLNLDEILAELERENLGEEEEELNESEEEEDLDEAKKKDKEEKDDKKDKPKSKPKEEKEDDEDEEVGEMTVDELREFIVSVVDELQGNEEEEMPMDSPEGEEMEDFSTDPSMSNEEEPTMAEDRLYELKREKDLIKKKLKETETKLNESLKTIKTLLKEQNETNLLNAKLLYMNKIFKSAQSLTESQKLSIIDTLDKASTVKEAKLIYETLNNSIKSKSTIKKSPIKESLGLSSKPIGSTKKIIEADPIVARWQKLAGLK